jgi:diguanylate cyclase (GGDEF)-like protein/putative nucleotidyltransferase with HDIG domain
VAEAEHTSGLTSRLVLAYVEREAGADGVVAVLRVSGLSAREKEMRDENAWFSYDAKIRLFEATATVLDDPQVMRRVGASALELNVGEGVKLALRALGSPSFVYKNVVRANAKFSRSHSMELLDLGSEHARVGFLDLVGVEFSPHDCLYTQGLLSCIPALFGLPLAQVSHPACVGDGAQACVYDVNWTPRRRLRWARHRARARELEIELESQREASDRLLASLHDLGSELRLDTVLGKVARNARAAVPGKECLVLLADENGLTVHDSPLTPGATTALERWANASPRVRDGAMLVDDVVAVPDLAPLVAPGDRRFASFCSAPTSSGGELLGLLVALTEHARTFLPRDVDLIDWYAAQAGMAIRNARLYEAQEALASRDPLTGLLNHRSFHETLEHELERSRRRTGSPLTLVLLDLDGFKAINDAGGHAEGDRTLARVADAIRDACRTTDLAFRVGGDEFAIVLPDAADDASLSVVERVRAAIATADPRITASVGHAAWPRDGGSKDVLISEADGRLYTMKRQRERPREEAEAPALPLAALAGDARPEGEALLLAQRAKDPQLAQHALAVADLSCRVAARLGLGADQSRTLWWAASLHDIGKIGVRASVLSAPGPLSAEQRAEIERHSVLGAELLAGAPALAHLAPIVRAAHERWDGRGYPDGLSGTESPLEARIIAACDAYHAMISGRPYRSALHEAQAREELADGAGVQFDPDVVPALLAELGAPVSSTP